MRHICPVCGYLMSYPPRDFHICPSCGTEFGYDDAGWTLAELRATWLRAGANWWSTATPKPDAWDPYLQLDNLTTGYLLWGDVFTSSQGSVPQRLADMISGKDSQRANSGTSQQDSGGIPPRKAA
jgi:hypothetical protein